MNGVLNFMNGVLAQEQEEGELSVSVLSSLSGSRLRLPHGQQPHSCHQDFPSG